jgi:hypothetical protein
MTDLSEGHESRTKALDLPPGGRGRGKGSNANGRKDGTGTEETIKIRPLKDGCAECMKLYKIAEEAKKAYNAAAKAVSERGGINTGSFKKLITASAKGKYEDVRRSIEQQSVLFEKVGEVPGGSVSNSGGDPGE